ncbi:MAG: Wzz/FepE/Etk N-terminal domain-containing protein, partial [Anaerolineae bacterium]
MEEPSLTSVYVMDDEIDLRKYVDVIRRRWQLVVGVTLVAVIAAAVVSFLLPPVYEAASIVLITEPRHLMQFEPRFETVEEWQPAYAAFPELAISDGVLTAVVDEYRPSSAAQIENWSLSNLKGMVGSTSKGDPSLVKLTVSCHSPEDAAALANVWADKLVERGDDIYSQGEEDVSFFEQQVAQAEQTLVE